MKRHPLAIASDRFFSREGSNLSDVSTLGKVDPNKYLKNRLLTAFQSGYIACEQRVMDAMKEAIEEVKP